MRAISLMLAAIFVISISQQIVLAQDFSVTVNPPEPTFTGATSFALFAINNSGKESLFVGSQPFAVAPANMWATIENPMLTISAGASDAMRVRLTVAKDAKPGNYEYLMGITKQSTGEKIEKNFILTVKQRDRWAITKNLKLSCVQCQYTLNLFTDVVNVGKQRLDDVKLILTTPVKTYELNVGSLEPAENKSLNAFIDITGLEPQSYTITAEVVSGTQSMDREQVGFAIPKEKTIDVQRKETTTPWSKSVELVAINIGNALTEYEVKSQVTETFWATITYSQPPLARGDVWSWAIKLNPGESATITYTEFYWPVPLLFAIVIIGALYVYFFFTSIAMTKSVARRGEEFSVALHIRNRGVALDGVTVKDVVPAHFSLSGKFETLKPIARKVASGTEMIWRLGTVKRGEERVLHYRMKPHPTAHGALDLPAAHLTARKGKNVITTASTPIGIEAGIGPRKLRVKLE